MVYHDNLADKPEASQSTEPAKNIFVFAEVEIISDGKIRSADVLGKNDKCLLQPLTLGQRRVIN